MAKKRVIVTIDHRKVSDVESTIEQLQEKGLEFERNAAQQVFDITQIFAMTDKEVGQFDLPGVTCEIEHWKSEQ